ncbi:hypothetical protein [Enterococcus faecalis]|uniref:hypothetical protein n=1 Tax=Enterococcus faecalis TaxID=1351 RepID=UPI001573B85C|nr:hypothetical protein [Enterococcus faecalis]EHM3144217.1 hypothetical protein [Enterococcus faecalis]MCU2265817.1 hypothetical protein [Enterococcus faecalis]MDH7585529.1 hypothetical protein [Enterococcus faecalis]NSQ34568.1 hypothetical protein [Enterococcus faecalis]HBC7237044.1 hypothetical protein [Enterococcus faecalis]
MDELERELQLELERIQKMQERQAIQAVITAKQTRIATIKQTSTQTIKEMSKQSKTALPSSLKGAFQGQVADAASHYLKAIPDANLKTPAKGG